MKPTGPGQSPALLPDVVGRLRAAGADCAVIGAMAMAFHGVIRASLVVDLLVFPSGKPGPPLETAFAGSGYEVERRDGDADDPIPALIRLRDVHGNQVDLLLGLRRLDPAAAARAVEAEHQGTPLRFLGLEDLVALKLYAGGARDLEDARRLLEVAGPGLDLALLRRLASRFGGDERRKLDELLPGRS
jgi:hypothetical protein